MEGYPYVFSIPFSWMIIFLKDHFKISKISNQFVYFNFVLVVKQYSFYKISKSNKNNNFGLHQNKKERQLLDFREHNISLISVFFKYKHKPFFWIIPFVINVFKKIDSKSWFWWNGISIKWLFGKIYSNS